MSVAPAILVLNSQVARGAIGGRASVFVLERLGHRVWFVPTILLPWHPGHGPASRVTVPPAGFAELTTDLAETRWSDELGAILTGYFADVAQVEAAAAMIRRLKARHPGLIYLCDPVLGDIGPEGTGRLYIPEATATAIRDLLLPLADIATPNLFEAAWLAGAALPGSTAETLAVARALPCRTVIATSAPPMMARSVSTLLVAGETALAADHPLIEGAPKGTGDLFAALFLSNRLKGRSDEDALRRAATATFDMTARAVRHGHDELPIEVEQDVLVHSLLQVTLRRIGATARPRPVPR